MITSLLQDDFELRAVHSTDEARRFMLANQADAILLDIDLQERGGNGLDFLDHLQESYPEIPVIMLSINRSVEMVVDAMQRGADGYLGKKPSRADLVSNLRLAIKARRSQVRATALQKKIQPDKELVGVSPFIKRLHPSIVDFAASESPLCITGEQGTGKNLAARSIHALSERADEPFIVFNCAAFSGEQVEKELFGFEQGALSEQHIRSHGSLQKAGRGTILFEEITELNLETQTKLLRLLVDKSFHPVGSLHRIQFQARIIVASSRDLVQEMQKRRFRTELYYRLNVLKLNMHPLRERVEDIEHLTQYLIQKKALQLKRKAPALDDEALLLLQSQPWQGNVRELSNVIENALLHCDGVRLRSSCFRDLILETYSGLTYKEAKKKAEQIFLERFLSSVLRATEGHVSNAAKLIDVPRQTAHRLMDKVGLNRKAFFKSKGVGRR